MSVQRLIRFGSDDSRGALGSFRNQSGQDRAKKPVDIGRDVFPRGGPINVILDRSDYEKAKAHYKQLTGKEPAEVKFTGNETFDEVRDIVWRAVGPEAKTAEPHSLARVFFVSEGLDKLGEIALACVRSLIDTGGYNLISGPASYETISERQAKRFSLLTLLLRDLQKDAQIQVPVMLPMEHMARLRSYASEITLSFLSCAADAMRTSRRAAIAGPHGCGKTTILNMIRQDMRLSNFMNVVNVTALPDMDVVGMRKSIGDAIAAVRGATPWNTLVLVDEADAMNMMHVGEALSGYPFAVISMFDWRNLRDILPVDASTRFVHRDLAGTYSHERVIYVEQAGWNSYSTVSARGRNQEELDAKGIRYFWHIFERREVCTIEWPNSPRIVMDANAELDVDVSVRFMQKVGGGLNTIGLLHVF